MKDEIIILEGKIEIFNDMIRTFENENKIDSLDLKEKLNDILGQFEVCLKRCSIPSQYESLISAIRYANNIKKHSKKIFEYSIKSFAMCLSDSLLPSDSLFPSDFRIWWNKLPLDDIKFWNQYANYNQLLKGNDLPDSINKIYQIIKNNYV